MEKLKGAQYGIVKNAYGYKSSPRSHSRRYYIDAIFPKDNTVIREVYCIPEFYDMLVEGDNVMVVSFSYYRAYVIPIDSI